MLANDPTLRNPMGQPLPAGMHADSTYAAFLRGMGMDYTTAFNTAVQSIAQTRAQYATAIQRDPNVYAHERKDVNDSMADRGVYLSGERLTKLNDARVNDVNRRNDFATAQAQGIAGAEDALRQQVSALARNRVDQQGALQARHDQVNSQESYINAVRQAAIQSAQIAASAARGAGGGGGGLGGFSLGAPGAPAGGGGAGAPAADPFPEYHEGTSRVAYFNSLSQPQQMQFAAFLHGVTPNSKDPLTTLNGWLGVQQGVQGHPVSAGASRGNF